MKKTLFILLYFCSICQGQNSQIDSLLQVLKTANEDTNKVLTLNSLSEKLDKANASEKAKKYAGDALLIAKKIKFTKGEAEANYNLAMIEGSLFHYDVAMKLDSAAFNIFSQLKDRIGEGKCYLGFGRIYRETGNNAQSIKLLLESLRIWEEVGDKKRIAQTLMNLGSTYRLIANYKESVVNLKAAIKIYNEIGEKPGAISSYNELGSAYFYMDSLDLALDGYLTAMKLNEPVVDKRSLATSYKNIGAIYIQKRDYDKVLKYESVALKIAEELNSKRNILSCYINTGIAYDKLKKFALAKEYLNKGLALAKEIGLKESIGNAYYALEDLDRAMGNYKQALEDFKMCMHYRDTMFTEATERQATEMKEKYESEKKQKEITLLTKNNEIEKLETKKQKQLKYSFIGGLTLIILLLLFGYRVYRGRQMLRLQDIRNKIAGDLHDDIGSTLNSISIYSEVARNNDAQRDEALEMIGDSSRKIIDAMSDIVWTINPENDSFAKIIFRMKSLAHNLLRAKNIEYTFHTDEILNEKKLSLEDRRNFYLIFKEAINNLVKYSEANRVSISLSNENDHMKLSIKDNGVGFDMAKENAGNGLKSMKRRANEMKAKFKIESQVGQGTQIELILAA